MTTKQDTKALHKQVILALLEAATEAADANNWDTVVDLVGQIKVEVIKMQPSLGYIRRS